YRLTLAADGTASVEVDLAPLGSRAAFAPPAGSDGGRVSKVARAVTVGARDRYDAAGRLLAWVAANVGYELDRSADQSPEAVLLRRSAYCTGLARLSVALLTAAGIEAREVPGYVLEEVSGGPPAGFHRWIEVWYPDRGWVFSDPIASHHFVPATYLRLDEARLEAAPGAGVLLARSDGIREVDLVPGRAPVRAFRVRPNESTRLAAGLLLRLSPAIEGAATLEDRAGGSRAVTLAGGRGAFLGLEPGRYELKVRAAGRLAAWKMLTFRDRVLAELDVPVEDGRGEGVARR
ncbi:MAG: transglutaminase domain-containing protein, partial [Thermoanaerobaculia bacterium]